MIHLAIVLAGLAIAGYAAYDFVVSFRAATGSVKNRIWAAFEHAGSILWARFVQVVGAGVAVLAGGADWLNLPQVSDFIQKWLSDPVYVAAAFAGIAIVSELARRHKAGDLS